MLYTPNFVLYRSILNGIFRQIIKWKKEWEDKRWLGRLSVWAKFMILRALIVPIWPCHGRPCSRISTFTLLLKLLLSSIRCRIQGAVTVQAQWRGRGNKPHHSLPTLSYRCRILNGKKKCCYHSTRTYIVRSARHAFFWSTCNRQTPTVPNMLLSPVSIDSIKFRILFNTVLLLWVPAVTSCGKYSVMPASEYQDPQITQHLKYRSIKF